MVVGRPERKPARLGRGRRDVARSAVTRLSWSVRLRPLHRDAAAEKATRGTKRGVLRARSTAVGAAAQIYFLLLESPLVALARAFFVGTAKRRPAHVSINDCCVCSVRAWCGRVDVLLYRSDVD